MKCDVCGTRAVRRVGTMNVCNKCYRLASEELDTFASRLSKTDDAPHLIVVARAGTGKTTTLVEGMKVMKGLKTMIKPSPQQAAVWEQMRLSSTARSICFVAFNKAIAVELERRVPEGTQAMTLHSLGYGAVRTAFGNVRLNNYRTQDLISEVTGRDIRELRKTKMDVIKATEDLVRLCKVNLVDPKNRDDLWELIQHYDVDMNGNSAEVLPLVASVLHRCTDVDRCRCIDYDDMIWLPVALRLATRKYEVMLVDEAQDLNRCQQALVQQAVGDRGRLILCGDPKQAIYGFAGADAESMPRMEAILRETKRGCLQLPLTVTRRCGKKIVEEARKIVPDFDYWETNPEGVVSEAAFPEGKGCYTELVQDGDMILCRVNAPLISQCFRFLKAGRKAQIQGRDVGKGLINTINKMKAKNVEELLEKLTDWHHAEVRKQLAKRNPNDNRLIALQDRMDCLECFIEGQSTIEGVIARITAVFTDDKDSVGIKLSSIHKAKGLEAKRVFFLLPKGAGVPHPMAKTEWAIEQEWNLKYVAITRAIEELVYVS